MQNKQTAFIKKQPVGSSIDVKFTDEHLVKRIVEIMFATFVQSASYDTDDGFHG